MIAIVVDRGRDSALAPHRDARSSRCSGIGLVAVALFTKLGQEVIHQLRLGAGDTSAAGSDFQRGADAQLALAQIGARPIQGVGFSVITDAHVIYLQVLAAGGVIAMASFLVVSLRAGRLGSARMGLALARRASLPPPSRWASGSSTASSTTRWRTSTSIVVPGILIALVALGRRAPTGAAGPSDSSRCGRPRTRPSLPATR